MSVEIPEDDPTRVYTEAEQQRLTRNLVALTSLVHDGVFSARRFDVGLLQELHATLFDGVRSHSGRHRERGFGSERLTFGPYHSADRRDVPKKLAGLMQALQRESDRVADIEDEVLRVEAAIELAVTTHAKFVRIHPFEDGNGRTGRALMNIVLVRLGYSPVALEVPKQEYYATLNTLHDTGDSRSLVDLIIRLLSSQR